MKTILILLDSLNRRYLPVYGNTWVKAPNIDRLAEKSCIFDNHWTASAPCMPARHDIFTGRVEFLERSWSGIQPYDRTFPQLMKENNGYCHMVTDHYHFFHIGGENYHSTFDTWEFIRGQEYDVYRTPLTNTESVDYYGQYSKQYQANRSSFGTEENFPTPLTLQKSADWIRSNHAKDNWFLYIDAFDPHEPFDVPDDFDITYGDQYNEKHFNWPEYKAVDVPDDALEHIRKQYAKTLSLADRWLGKIFDCLDELDLWDEVNVVLTTDHGYLLGEHGYFAKNYPPAYNELYHIPLLVHSAGMNETSHCNAITQTVDLFPTLMELHKIPVDALPYKLHGKSIIPLLEGSVDKIRDYALYGIFGKQVNIYDGQYTYFRAAAHENNMPLNLYIALPTAIFHYWDEQHIDDIKKLENGKFLSWTDYPVYKISADNIRLDDPSHRFDQRYPEISQNLLFDIRNDYQQEKPLNDSEIENKLIQLMIRAMEDLESPIEQFIRLGLR